MPDQPCDVVCSILNLYKVENQQDSGSSNNGVMPNAPQLIRPRVDRGSVKKHGLLSFAVGKHSRLVQTIKMFIQLFQCAQDKLGDVMLANNPRWLSQRITMNCLERLPLVYVAKHISLQSVSVIVGKAM